MSEMKLSKKLEYRILNIKKNGEICFCYDKEPNFKNVRMNFDSLIENVKELENKVEQLENKLEQAEKENEEYAKEIKRYYKENKQIKRSKAMNQDEIDCIDKDRKELRELNDALVKENEELKSDKKRLDDINKLINSNKLKENKQKADKYDEIVKENEELKEKVESRETLHIGINKIVFNEDYQGVKYNNRAIFEKLKELKYNKSVDDDRFQKSKKYDNMHEFSKNVDRLIKGDMAQYDFKDMNVRFSIYEKNALYFADIKTGDNITILLNSIEENQQPHTFPFDYDKLEKLDENECIIYYKHDEFNIAGRLSNDKKIKFIERLSNNTKNISKENFKNLKFYILLNDKRLNQQQINDILNEK